MAFSPVLSDRLKKVLKKITVKNRQLSLAINKKIKQVCSCDEELIQHYKNLRNDLSDYKRVHVDKSFVLLFHVDLKNKKVYFSKLDHHDNIYKL
ncbi:MAG: addiction module toxin RelE [Candidatus Diapherotrites archaeon]|nr:addiction module toxin RelE [Candidatus Diapherotrites archaeon]